MLSAYLCHNWNIPHPTSYNRLHSNQAYQKYCVKLPPGYVYKLHMKQKWILYLDLYPAQIISHCVYENIQRYGKINYSEALLVPRNSDIEYSTCIENDTTEIETSVLNEKPYHSNYPMISLLSCFKQNCFISARWVSRWYCQRQGNIRSDLWAVWQSLTNDIFHQSQGPYH